MPRCVPALVLLTAGLALAPTAWGLDDISFTATRKKLDQSKERASNTSVESREVVYTIKVTSRSFKPLSGVSVAYNIFYETPMPGSTGKAPVEQAVGKQVFQELLVNKPVEFDTKPFKLSSSQLDGNWYYTSGAKNTTRDRVVGIWLKATDADGKVIGEYVNPSTVRTKLTWKNPG